MSILNELHCFFKHLSEQNVELYNEPGLQHELAIFLRERLKPDEIKIEYPRDLILDLPLEYPNREKTLKDIKKESSDIYLRIDDNRYIIELKMPQRKNDGIPNQKVGAVKDVVFLQKLLDLQTSKRPLTLCYAIFLSSDQRFWKPHIDSECYVHRFFGGDTINFNPLPKNFITRGFENDKLLAKLHLNQEYQAKWSELKINDEDYRFYIIELFKSPRDATLIIS